MGFNEFVKQTRGKGSHVNYIDWFALALVKRHLRAFFLILRDSFGVRFFRTLDRDVRRRRSRETSELTRRVKFRRCCEKRFRFRRLLRGRFDDSNLDRNPVEILVPVKIP